MALSAAVTALGGWTASAATPGGQDPGTQEFVQSVGQPAIDDQDALSTFRGWMIDQPGFATSGYVGAVDDLAHKAITVLWSGPRTALLTAILAEGQRRDIATTVQQRAHSLQQLDAAADAVRQQAAHGGWTGFTISSIEEVGATDTGLTVNGTYTAVPETQRAPQVRSLSTTALGVPVHLVPGVSAENFNGRDDDTPPFGAGGYMIGPGGTTCSNGFGVKVGHVTRVTTARHCDDYPYHARHGSANYGDYLTESTDGAALELTGPSSAKVKTGPYDSTGLSKTVIGFEDLAVGDSVCTSGGNSGEHCHVKVTNLRVSYDDGHGPVVAIKGVQQKADDIAAIQGDSGGPVYYPVQDTSKARAAGMIQAGEAPFLTGSDCGRVSDAGKCSKTVLFTSMRTIVNNLPDARLNTG